MEVSVGPSRVEGRVEAPPSKSWGIRTIFYSLINRVTLSEVPNSDDIAAAINAVKALGVKVEGGSFEFEEPSSRGYAFVGGSATTLRMLLPVAMVLGVELEVDGDESLRRRPLNEIVKLARRHGLEVTSERLPLKIKGELKEEEVEISGAESSQYVSGFMFAFAVRGHGRIRVLPPVSSKSYIMMTAELLTSQGVRVEIERDDVWEITIARGNPRPYEGKVRGDFALASFYAIASSVTGGRIEISGLYDPPSYFGDHSVVNLMAEAGVKSAVQNGTWIAEGEPERGLRVNVDDAPDLAVSIAALAPFARTETVIEGVERLRIKESDRITTIISTLKAFGGRARYDGRLVIEPNRLREGVIECPNDHRIAMLAAVLALTAGGKVLKAECVNKSNPRFWDDLKGLGARITIS
ncbi:MAG: 3-phosphoshikimate 1-carboxyvinyltransferase [Sulfolobales archaeon]|nr:3-phosphoshikimate 1-carboxyvinyltransferase [Sulfolobales archaeon]MCG2910602.1 3-phosphoshikimate 1-carboxyvinyltransferase [Sulfolobales archaeon]